MNGKILFIGGPNDGKRMHIPNDLGHVAVPEMVIGPPSDTDAPSFNAVIQVKTHTYTHHNFNGGGLTFQALVHSSITNPMEALLKGYRYHRKPSHYPKRNRYARAAYS